jgi:hypothetical protein
MCKLDHIIASHDLTVKLYFIKFTRANTKADSASKRKNAVHN